jgi:hypothetical protein
MTKSKTIQIQHAICSVENTIRYYDKKSCGHYSKTQQKMVTLSKALSKLTINEIGTIKSLFDITKSHQDIATLQEKLSSLY